MKKEIYYCPICGYELEDYFGSGELCPCCFREAGCDDELCYDEIDGESRNQKYYEILDREEIRKIIPDYKKKYNLEEYVPQEIVWDYLRAIWIKSGSPYTWDIVKKVRLEELERGEDNYEDIYGYKVIDEPDWTKEKAYRQLKRIGVDAREFIKSIWGEKNELYKEAVEIMK
ncbi:hypothetical protein [Velocimicrobium porci]|uniref:Uncharacterized protein n=1 Tax=Velocimicrobium porci TaxID=2606634 RepID=A0A6L5XXI3_9FIRM|nr:hypothetical protein [Velocimicrobium porci]MSS63576.1 hypothetical protein [Velocimicrobium porci]